MGQRRAFSSRAAAPLIGLLASAATVSCVADFDTTRQSSTVKTTLGEEMFTGLCDRVGASSLSEDHTGASFHGICHKGPKGWTTFKVDTSGLPPATGKLAEPRRQSIAKIEAMAQRRAELIEAFDAAFPDDEIPDPADPKKKVRLHDALDALTKRMVALYESSPYSTKERPEPALMPATTQALGAFMGSLADNDEARDALARISGREGYRPLARALGTARTLLAYPDLRSLTRLLLDRTGPGGPLEGKLQHLLRVVEQELRTFEADPKAPALTVDAARLQPSRARFKIEILGAALLGEDDAYARGQAASYMVTRDLRGFALPLGGVAAPFVDKNGDGMADVDLLGRFVDGEGYPLLAAPPFVSPNTLYDDQLFAFDASGRATFGGKPLYAYTDTTRTFLHAALDDLRPHVQPAADGPSTLMNALEGSYPLFGKKKAGKAEYGSGSDRVSFSYDAFDASTSAAVELTHAAGQFLGAPESDDYLGSILALHEKHPEKTARTLQLAWAIWNRSKNPEYAQAVLADSSTFWDEMGAWLAKVARVGPEQYVGKPGQKPRGLMQELTLGLAHPNAVKYLPAAFAPPMQFNDRIGYNPSNINGPPVNKTSNFALKEGGSAFQSKVNRSLPDQGDNRSAFQRFAHIIAAANHVNTCNKPDTLVKSTLSLCGFDLDLTYPIKLPFQDQETIAECDLLDIRDLGIFFVDSSLAFNHPRRARLKIKDSTLTGLLGVVEDLVPGFCGDLDINSVLQGSTGLTGLTTVPTPQALMRLVFFGAQGKTVNKPELLDPLITGINNNLNLFISNTLDPAGTSVCPQNAKGVNVCDDYSKTLRGVEPDTFFVAETPYLATHPPECLAGCEGLGGLEASLCQQECNGPSSGFFEGIRPTLTAFANYSYLPEAGEVCTKDSQGRCAGEQLFLDLMSILDRHWPTGGSSIYRYEDLLAWALSAESDLFGTVSDLVNTMDTFDYTSPRVKQGQKRSPLDVTASMVSFLFDPAISASLGIVDRNGNKATTTNDGKAKPQLTPFDLFAQSLRSFDRRFDGDDARKARWRSARSALVDQFLLAEKGAWKNAAIARSLPVIGKLTREQVNANCPDRESSKQCGWARKEMADKLASVIEGPLFGAINDLNEALRADDELRAELEKFLVYLTQSSDDPDSFAQTLTSLADLLQALNDEQNLAPILRGLAPLATPGVIDDGGELTPTENPGFGSLSLKYLKATLDEPEDEAKRIDRYRVLDHVLPRMVTPLGDGKRAPLEVMTDAIAAIQRVDSADKGAFSPEDYRALSSGLRTFLVDDYRGLEQFYTIVRGRNGN